CAAYSSRLRSWRSLSWSFVESPTSTLSWRPNPTNRRH
ncbi:MAG: hypothetical protein AVDCRST_MAG03-2601, partial [uncultured Rubrobacteraceae bacterium]